MNNLPIITVVYNNTAVFAVSIYDVIYVSSSSFASEDVVKEWRDSKRLETYAVDLMHLASCNEVQVVDYCGALWIRKDIIKSLVDYSDDNNKTVYIIKDYEFYYIVSGECEVDILDSIQAGNPHKLDVVFSKKVNNASTVISRINYDYKRERMRGNWFELSKDDIEDIVSWI